MERIHRPRCGVKRTPTIHRFSGIRHAALLGQLSGSLLPGGSGACNDSGRVPVACCPSHSPTRPASQDARAPERNARDDLEFLAQLLANYNGHAFTHDLTKRIVDALPANDALLQHIGMALDSTESLRGEFGLVEAYRVKRQEMEPWLADSRERVREFARRHIHHLDLQLSAEQRRSEEALEFRKRSFPSPEQPEG